MRIGIAFDLRSEQALLPGAPDDRLEEYDSEETVAAIEGALRRAGHQAVRLGGGRGFVERLLACSEGADAIDLVFNLAEGRDTRSREAQVPAVCELLRVPFTHSDPLTLALCLDKAMAKRIVASHGVATPRFVLAAPDDDLAGLAWPRLPLIVKLNAEGSSMGIRHDALCRTIADVRTRIDRLRRTYGGGVLVEEFLPGREVTVCVLGNGAAARVAAMMEVAPRDTGSAAFLYTIDAKRQFRERVQYHVPPRLAEPDLQHLARTALAAYRALGCRDVARLDLRFDADDVPAFIEANPIPGLHPAIGDLPIACGLAGLGYDALIAGIVDDARDRLRR